MIDELRFKKWFQSMVADSGKKIEESEGFLSLLTTSYKESPQCALELGIAVILDKPILLLVPDDVEIPNNLLKIAKGVQRFKTDDMEDMKRATNELMKDLPNQEGIR